MFASTIHAPEVSGTLAHLSTGMQRKSVLADVPGLHDAMVDVVSAELIGSFNLGDGDFGSDLELAGSSNFRDDGLDFLNEKARRRAAYHHKSSRFGGHGGGGRVRSAGEAERARFEKKAVRQAIDDGVSEYYHGDFDDRRKRRGKRGGAHRSRRLLSLVVTAGGADHIVEGDRTGRAVPVVVKPTSPREQRKRSMAGLSPSRLRLSTAEVRRRMGLDS